MSNAKAIPDYHLLNNVLTHQGVGMNAAEMHGLLSGILCGGNQDASWKSLVHDLTNEGMAYSAQLSQQLEVLHQHILTTLCEEGFGFQLYLPADQDHSVFDRADALAGWVNHFLLGLGVTQPKLDKVKDEAGEAIDDLRTIAQLGYDEDDAPEELAQSLEEVAEYVRVAALLCFETFNPEIRAAEPSGSTTPILH